MKDFYAILGIAPDAELDTIKAAYRQLAQAHHPDLRPHDPDATEQFLAIKEAYECLSDEESRAAYDQEYVTFFPGYVLEGEEEEITEPNAPTVPSNNAHGDGSTTLFRIFLVLLLPLVCGGLVMNFSGDFAWTIIAAVGGLAAAIWIAAIVRES